MSTKNHITLNYARYIEHLSILMVNINYNKTLFLMRTHYITYHSTHILTYIFLWSLYVSFCLQEEKNCGAPCHAMFFAESERTVLRYWVGSWAALCCASCLFTVSIYNISIIFFSFNYNMGTVCFLLFKNNISSETVTHIT